MARNFNFATTFNRSDLISTVGHSAHWPLFLSSNEFELAPEIGDYENVFECKDR